jgi:hypothetical protein
LSVSGLVPEPIKVLLQGPYIRKLVVRFALSQDSLLTCKYSKYIIVPHIMVR